MTHRIMAHTMKAVAALSAVTLTMGLAACGGGGSSSSADNSQGRVYYLNKKQKNKNHGLN